MVKPMPSLKKFLYQLDQLQKIIFSCLLKRDYFQYQDEYEKKFFQTKAKLFTQLCRLQTNQAVLRQLTEIIFSLNTLKFRVADQATFEVCQRELADISRCISSALQQVQQGRLLDLTAFSQAIENFSALYQDTLRIVTADPAAFLFFIESLLDFREQLQSFHPAQQKLVRKIPRISTHANARHVISMLIALMVSVIAAYFFASTGLFLMPAVALFVMQTSIASAFSQGIWRLLLVSVLVSLAALTVSSMNFLYHAMHDVFIGGFIGIATHLLVFPRLADVEFRAHVVKVLKAYQRYFVATMEHVLEPAKKPPIACELELLHLPGWVYNRGFDMGMRKGHRFFLMTIGRMNDVLFSLHHFSNVSFEQALIEKLRGPLMRCTESVKQFFAGLITLLELKKLRQPIEDFSIDLQELEEKFQNSVTLSLELLDVKRDYVCFAALIADLAELRELLLKLAQALR